MPSDAPKPFMVFDTETNGLPDFKKPADDPGQPRIVQISAGLFLDDWENPIDEFCHLIKPDGWKMDDALAEKLGNGLTHARLEAEGIPILQALSSWEVFHSSCSVVVGYNVTFDLKLMRGELRRAGRPDHYGERPHADVMRPCVDRCKIPPTEKMMATGRKFYKTPKLSEALKILLGAEHADAHDARADMRGTARLYLFLGDAVKPKQSVATPKPETKTTAAAPADATDFLG